MVMNAARLEHFLGVVDHGTVTAAAAARHVSQPALSQSLRLLEREVGTPLFHRVGRMLRLTAAGDALVEPARRVLRDLDIAHAAVAAVAGVVAGTLDLACLPTLASDPVAELVGRFRRAHPAVVVRISAPDDPADLMARVRAGDVELGITEQPDPVPDGVTVRALGDQDLVWLLPPGSGRAGPATFAFVTTPPGTSSRDHLDEASRRAGFVPVIAVETAQRDAIVPLVLAGAGAALVPEPIAADARRRGARRRVCEPPARRALALVHRAAPLSPAAQRFAALSRASR